jgi:predicted RNase H-like nuclease (RuvC/YqgF family)
MDTCEKHNHCVIVTDRNYCPLCEAEKEIDRYLGDIEELKQDNVSFRDENKSYESTIESLRSELDSIKNDPTQGGD